MAQCGCKEQRWSRWTSLGSTVQSNGDCGSECRKRVQAGWKKVAGVICDGRPRGYPRK